MIKVEWLGLKDVLWILWYPSSCLQKLKYGTAGWLLDLVHPYVIAVIHHVPILRVYKL